jgi:hypothetical protein
VVAQEGAEVAGGARRALEARTGKSVVSKLNAQSKQQLGSGE